MTSGSMGLLLGGLLAAVFFGLSGIFMKASAQSGIGLGPFIIITGIAVILVGCVFWLIDQNSLVSARSGAFAFLNGALWATGIGLVALALTKYQAPLAQLVPLYNMNTLITVLLGLWIFAEWQQVKSLQLLAGSALIVLGGVLVSRA